MSELDATRRERLTTLLRRDGQAVITTTELEHVPGGESEDVEKIFISGGQAIQRGDDSARGLASLGGLAQGARPPAGRRDAA